MADAELMERCMEEIATTVQDAGDAISYRTLGTSSQVTADVSRLALDKFAQENESSVGAIQVIVQRGVVASSSSSSSTADPRARIIRIGSFSPEQSTEKVLSKQIYSVYKKSAEAVDGEDDAAEPISIACWSQERSLRNDIFQKVAKQAPLSRAIKSFYESGIKCVEATTRTGFGDSQGEESISIFDSLKASIKPASSSATGSSARSSTSTPSTSSNGSKSFFKSTGSATNTSKSRATSSATSSTRTTPVAAKQPETKKIDAKSMSNVFTIDSDDDDDEDDGDAPVFVKKSQSGATTKPRSKRVISDDEDEDDDEDFAKPVAKSSSTKTPVAQSKKSNATSSSNNSNSRSVKRKLGTSPDDKNHAILSDSDEPKRTKPAKSIENMDDEDDEDTVMAVVQEEEDEQPIGIRTKRIVETTKTRINEQGYMVTEKTVEEVELTAEEIEQEKLQAAKKKKQQQAAKAKAEAAKAAAEKKAAAKGAAPAKQKNLLSFFQRK